MDAKKIDLKVDNVNIIGFYDFGSEMTEQFKVVFHTFFTKEKLLIHNEFWTASIALFNNFDSGNIVSLSDNYFNNFTVVTQQLLNSGRYNAAFFLWTAVLDFIQEWETKNPAKKLHKGTPYYFSAIASILGNDFDAAIMSMNNALQEDKRVNPDWENAPAYTFLILNDKKEDHYFKEFVDGTVGFLRDRLDGEGNEKGRYKDHYKNRISKSLDYESFRKKFLENQNISEEIRFSFVYVLLRLWRLRVLHKNKVGDTLIAPIIFSNVLFVLLLVIDNLLQGLSGANNGNGSFPSGLSFLAKQENWDSAGKDYIEELDINRRSADFGVFCKELLVLNYKTKSGRILDRIESDFALAYGLRNFSAHTIQSQHILWENHTKILQSLFNCLFKSIEII